VLGPVPYLELSENPSSEDARYLRLHLDRKIEIKLEKAHIHQAKTIWNSTEQDIPTAR